MTMRRFHGRALAGLSAAAVLAAAAGSNAGEKLAPDDIWCGDYQGVTTCVFSYAGVRASASTTDFASFGLTASSATHGWPNETSGWFVASVGNKFYSCTAQGPALASWPVMMQANQWVQIDYDTASATCFHVQLVNASDEVRY